MRSRASVVLNLRLAVVGRDGNEADSFCGDIKIVLDEALMVVEYLNHGAPFAIFVLRLDLIVLDEALGESEGGAVMTYRRGRSIYRA